MSFLFSKPDHKDRTSISSPEKLEDFDMIGSDDFEDAIGESEDSGAQESTAETSEQVDVTKEESKGTAGEPEGGDTPPESSETPPHQGEEHVQDDVNMLQKRVAELEEKEGRLQRQSQRLVAQFYQAQGANRAHLKEYKDEICDLEAKVEKLGKMSGIFQAELRGANVVLQVEAHRRRVQEDELKKQQMEVACLEREREGIRVANLTRLRALEEEIFKLRGIVEKAKVGSARSRDDMTRYQQRIRTDADRITALTQQVVQLTKDNEVLVKRTEAFSKQFSSILDEYGAQRELSRNKCNEMSRKTDEAMIKLEKLKREIDEIIGTRDTMLKEKERAIQERDAQNKALMSEVELLYQELGVQKTPKPEANTGTKATKSGQAGLQAYSQPHRIKSPRNLHNGDNDSTTAQRQGPSSVNDYKEPTSCSPPHTVLGTPPRLTTMNSRRLSLSPNAAATGNYSSRHRLPGNPWHYGYNTNSPNPNTASYSTPGAMPFVESSSSRFDNLPTGSKFGQPVQGASFPFGNNRIFSQGPEARNSASTKAPSSDHCFGQSVDNKGYFPEYKRPYW